MLDHRSPLPLLILVLVLGLFGLSGCGGTPPAAPGDAPEGLTLKLYSKTTTGRYTYFELSKKGELGFGGGQKAAQRVAAPVTALSAVQRRRVWQIINDYHLAEAKGQLLEKAEKVAYELEMNTGLMGHKFRSVDDKVAGVKELHDYLFGIQAEVRYTVPGLK